MTEEELAAIVVENLQEGWDVYQEVQVHGSGGVADIVAVAGPKVWIIEVKKTLSWVLLEQALRWRGWAHLVSIATPIRKRGKGSQAIQIVLRTLGIGHLEVHRSEYEWRSGVNECVRPRWNKAVENGRAIRDRLCEEHKSFAKAGTAGGGHFTPFKATCKELRALVKCEPGISLREAFGRIKHHYASINSACGAMRTWILEGKVKGLRVEYRGRTPHLFPRNDRESDQPCDRIGL